MNSLHLLYWVFYKIFLRVAGCAKGTYGTECMETCGLCKAGQPCNESTGFCDSGCESGLKAPFCNESEPSTERIFLVINYNLC